MTWSDLFRTYIERRFGDSYQQKTAVALEVSPSAVSYWCRGSKPRESTRRRIAEWSGGEVPVAGAVDESGPGLKDADATGEHPALDVKPTGS